jgi:T5orf172 domain
MNYKNFNSSDLWHQTPVAPPHNLPESGLFRISLSDLEKYFWKANRSNPEILNNLFNSDYFDQHCIVTDSETLDRLKLIPWSCSTNGYQGGFIYCYTEQNYVLAGKEKEGIWFWENTRYNSTFKCGMSDRHPLKRISEQYPIDELSNKFNINKPSPPILLSLLWTGSAFLAEREIHSALDSRRVTDNQGRSFRRAGAEWFIDRPENMMKVAYPIVMNHRKALSEDYTFVQSLESQVFSS